MTYTADNWREAYDTAYSSGFDRVDSEECAGPMGAALADAYDKIVEHKGARQAVNEDVVRAAIEAAASRFSEWDVEQFLAVVGNFSVHYEDMNEPMKDHLKENYPGVQLEWLRDDASIWDEITKDSEIWVDVDDIPGIYVFQVGQ
jgi:hypothetical protein